MKTAILINTASISDAAVQGFTSKPREYKSYKFGQNIDGVNKFYAIKPLSETETNITFEVCSQQ
jgi:hypothetical protein